MQTQAWSPGRRGSRSAHGPPGSMPLPESSSGQTREHIHDRRAAYRSRTRNARSHPAPPHAHPQTPQPCPLPCRMRYRQRPRSRYAGCRGDASSLRSSNGPSFLLRSASTHSKHGARTEKAERQNSFEPAETLKSRGEGERREDQAAVSISIILIWVSPHSIAPKTGSPAFGAGFSPARDYLAPRNGMTVVVGPLLKSKSVIRSLSAGPLFGT